MDRREGCKLTVMVRSVQLCKEKFSQHKALCLELVLEVFLVLSLQIHRSMFSQHNAVPLDLILEAYQRQFHVFQRLVLELKAFSFVPCFDHCTPSTSRRDSPRKSLCQVLDTPTSNASRR